MKYTRQNRRDFLKGAATVSGGLFLPNIVRSQEAAPSKRVNVASIGVGGKGRSDMEAAAKDNEIVALCDVDENALKSAAEKFPNAKLFRDFREMLTDMGDKIDAVTISTPDHAHFVAAMEAIKHGKHICVQKPLVNTLYEARQLHTAARKKSVITQMGNQGHTGEGIRLLKEWIDHGIVGKVKDVHVWTNRPIWAQGSAANYQEIPPPDSLDWTAWQAAIPDRAYLGIPDGQDDKGQPKFKGLHPFQWRGHREYGAGAMGDMGCHLLDGPFYSLGLAAPCLIEADVDDITQLSWPKAATIALHFKDVPGHGDVKLTWYSGGRKPERPVGLTSDRELSLGGFLIVGEEGTLYDQSDYCQSPRLLDGERMKAWMKSDPKKTLERSPTPGSPQEEWTIAIKNGQEFPWMSQFDYSMPLTELCLLGNLALAAPSHKVEWDAAKFTSGDEATNKLLNRAAYRDGYITGADQV